MKLFFIASVLPLIAVALLTKDAVESAGAEPALIATYTNRALHLTIPFRDAAPGPGNLTVEVLDPDDRILGRTKKHLESAAGSGQWTGHVKLDKPIALEDLVWERVHYRLDYDNGKNSALQGTESQSVPESFPRRLGSASLDRRGRRRNCHSHGRCTSAQHCN